MTKRVLTIIGLLLIIIGVVISTVCGFTSADLIGFAVTMFGAGLATADMWKNRKEGSKTWLNILALAFVGVGSFLSGLINMISESTMTTVIGCVISITLIVLGLITSKLVNKDKS